MFNPNDHMIALKGKQYLPVNARVAWFRDVHGTSWRILTEQIPYDDPNAFCMKASIIDADGCIIATAHKVEHTAHFSDALEKAETGSIGRALALCGFGTLFAQELETPITPDGDMRIADAPVEPIKRRSMPVVQGDTGKTDLAAAGNKFRNAVMRFEPDVQHRSDRLKTVFRILTKDAERTVESLATATSMVIACETLEQYEVLLRSLAKGNDAMF